MNPGHRTKHYRKIIDQWWFATDTKWHEKEIVVFNIILSRDADMQEGADKCARRPKIKFRAEIDRKNTSPAHAFAEVEIDDENIHKLRERAQQMFEQLTAKDWKKIILVFVGADVGSFHTKLQLEFSYAVCEKAGELYRRDDGWITRDANNLCGGTTLEELPYTETTEQALLEVETRLKQLATNLRTIIKTPSRLHALVQSVGFPALR